MFFLTFAFQQVMGGIATPGWFDFFAKLTPMKKRGRLIGLRISVGGIGAFFTGLLLTWLLLRFAFPTNYALALLIASLFQFLSLAVQFRLVEAEPSKTVELKPIFAFLRQLPVVLRGNHDFRRFLVSAAFLIPATMPVGFFTVYALQRFQASESMVGAFTLSMVAIQVVSALVTGLTADRHGHKVALLIAAAAMLLATLTALLAPAVEWFILVFVFVGINAGTEVMSRFNIAVEYGPPEQRSTYIGLMNTVLAPFYLSGLLAGAISQMFGYEVLFGAGILCSLIGSWFLYSRVRDPRVLHGTSHSPDAP